jgi:hypothetical protein
MHGRRISVAFETVLKERKHERFAGWGGGLRFAVFET